MKNIIKIFVGAAAVIAFGACSNLNTTPVFDDADSFAAFDVTSVAVAEDQASVSIPVKIASIDPKKTVVAFEIIDATADETYSAKLGTDFKLADESATLAFDGQAREAELVVNIIGHSGEYTGDLTFAIKIVSATGLNIGYDKTVVVTIQDNDHPLADILGTYEASGTSYFNGAMTWTTTMTKDPKDITIVWFSNLAGLGEKEKFYGVVSDDHSTITIPIGQKYQYSSSYYCNLYAFDDKYIYDETEVASVKLVKNEAGAFVCDDYGFCCYATYVSDGSGAGSFEIIYPGISYTKK